VDFDELRSLLVGRKRANSIDSWGCLDSHTMSIAHVPQVMQVLQARAATLHRSQDAVGIWRARG
jgi:hypothetical protein